jgi:hypothetical protein
MPGSLVRQNAIVKPNAIPLPPSRKILAIELVLTAQNAKVLLSEELQSEFVREFEDESPELLERVFRAWRRRSKFMPAISEIYDLLEEEAHTRYQERQMERSKEDREDTAAARESWQDPEKAKRLEQQAADLARKLSLRNPLTASRPFIVTRSHPVSPGIVLTAEQIAERREKERQEIEALKEAGEWNGEEVMLRKTPKPLGADAGESQQQAKAVKGVRI